MKWCLCRILGVKWYEDINDSELMGELNKFQELMRTREDADAGQGIH